MTPETPITTELSPEEAAEEAESLIREFKTTLLGIPEFGQRAGRAFLGLKDEKDEYPPHFEGVCFRSGAFIYGVYYSSERERKELRITKHPQDGRLIETINLIINVDFGPSPQFAIEKPQKITHEGIIQYCKMPRETEPPELYTNNRMAIEKIEKFLLDLELA